MLTPVCEKGRWERGDHPLPPPLHFLSPPSGLVVQGTLYVVHKQADGSHGLDVGNGLQPPATQLLHISPIESYCLFFPVSFCPPSNILGSIINSGV